jgi:hypothetical protein
VSETSAVPGPNRLPRGLNALVAHYAGEAPEPVRFRPASWVAAVGSDACALLYDESTTHRSTLVEGDRVTDIERVRCACAALRYDHPQQLAQLLVLVMAWGSGTSGSRSYRNVARTLGGGPHSPSWSVAEPRLVRAVQLARDDNLMGAYRTLRGVPGIGRSFFTKWLAFAGRVEGRNWNPLILDDRVLATLNNTLKVSTKDFTSSRLWAYRYEAYVQALHRWAAQLPGDPPVDADRLEWILYRHNGKPLDSA